MINRAAFRGWRRKAAAALGVLVLAACVYPSHTGFAQAPAPSSPAATGVDRLLLDRYRVTCHNDRSRAGGLTLSGFDPERLDEHPDTWEKVVRRLRASEMPPSGAPRPGKDAVSAFVARLESGLDRRALSATDPGPWTTHRLNRTEYVNAIRDLLAVEVDGPSLLPADDVAEGFDNMASVLTVSPMLMERYLSAARRVSRLAVGDPTIGPSFEAKAIEIPVLMFQDHRMSEDLPFGSRGGAAVRYRFPLNGEYLIKVTLRRNLYSFIRGLAEPHTLEIRVDGVRAGTFTVGGGDRGKPAPLSYAQEGASPQWEEYVMHADENLQVRAPIAAGTHTLGVSFLRRDWEPEGILQPGSTQFAFSTDESLSSPSGKREPAVQSVAISGPSAPSGPGDTNSRRRLFVCQPTDRASETPCAKRVLATVARRAFRRPVLERDLQSLLEFYEIGRREGGFEAGIQEALVRILVDPEFLFRVEQVPDGWTDQSSRRIPDMALASRLSFFLWSSIPDDELLDVAARGRLSDPTALRQQVRRMLADERSTTLVRNFAAQWLELRNLAGVNPNPELFPETDFDENLRDALIRETELFLESQRREDRSVVDLIRADYTFVNERLARHYGIANVYGSRFRRVTLDGHSRGGLLGQGSILMLTSYGNRTSPVLRGQWLLTNVFGTPPPPPIPNVPGLVEKTENGKTLSARQALKMHRASPVCASCHSRMDPLGLALKNFDAIGRWRTIGEDGSLIDASGSLPDGSHIDGVSDIRKLIERRPREFVATFTAKLLTYAVGRSVEHYDMPAVRRILRDAESDGYRWSSIILGVVESVPFQRMRPTP